MPDPSQMSPGMLLDPSDYVTAQRKQMLAQALMQQAMTPSNPQSVGGVTPRVSPLSVIARMAEGYMSRKAMDQGSAAQQRLMQAMISRYAPGGQQTSSGTPLQMAPQGDPNEVGPQPMVQRNPGQSLAQTIQQSRPQYSPTNPLNPQGMDPIDLMQMSPAERQKYQLGPESVQLGRYAGVAPQDAARAAYNKANAIDTRPGGMIMLPDGTQIRNPTLPTGMQPDGYDAQGKVTSASGIPGVVPYQGALTGIETGAREANTPQTIPIKGGGSTFGYPGDVHGVGLPPSLRQGAAGAQAAPPNSTPQYFAGNQPPAPAPGAMPNRFASAGAAAAPPTAPVAPTGQADPFAGAPKVPSYSGMGAPTNTDAVVQKARGEEHVALFKQYGAESAAADQQLLRIQEAQKALAAGINAGPASQAITHMEGYLHQLMPKLFAGDAATNTQVFNKNAVNNAIIGAKSLYGPRMTSSEVMLQKNEANPSAEMTSQAISYLLNQQAIVAQYNKQRNSDYQSYVASGHDPLQFEGWYSANKPVQQFALQRDTARQVQLAADRGAQVPEEAFRRLNANPALKAGFQKQYGYIPDGY